MKGRISFLLAVLMVLTMLPINTLAEGSAGLAESVGAELSGLEEEEAIEPYVLPVDIVAVFSSGISDYVTSGAGIALNSMKLNSITKVTSKVYRVYFDYAFGNLDYYVASSAGRAEILEYIRQNMVVSYSIGNAAEVALTDSDIIVVGSSNNGTVGGTNGITVELNLPQPETEVTAALKFNYAPTNTTKEISTAIAGKTTAKLEGITINGSSAINFGSDGLSATLRAYDSGVMIGGEKALQLTVQYMGKIKQILLEGTSMNYSETYAGQIRLDSFIPTNNSMKMEVIMESADSSIVKTYTVTVENHMDLEDRLVSMNLNNGSKATSRIYRIYFDYAFGNLARYTSGSAGRAEVLEYIRKNIEVSYKIGNAAEVALTDTDIKIVGTANNGTAGGINGVELELNLPEFDMEVAATLQFTYKPTKTSGSIATTMPGKNLVAIDSVRLSNGSSYSSRGSDGSSFTLKALDSSVMVNGQKALQVNLFYTANIKQILLDGKALGYDSRYSGGGEVVTEPFVPADSDMTMMVTVASENGAVEKTYTITIKNYLVKSVEPDYARLTNSNKSLEVRFGSSPRVGDTIKIYSSLTAIEPIQTFTVAEGATATTQIVTLNTAATSNLYVGITTSGKEESKLILSTGYTAPSSGGDNGNNGTDNNSGTNNNSSSSDSDNDDNSSFVPTSTGSTTTTTTSSQTASLNTVAQDMISNGKDLQLTLTGSATNVSLSGETLTRALNNNKPLEVKKDNVSAVVPTNILENLNLKSSDNVTLSFDKVSVKSTENINTKSDSLNQVLLEQAFEVNLYVNGNNVTSFDQPLSLRFDVSAYKMSKEQKNKLTGVRHLEDGTYDQLGGTWISANVFEFQTSKLSIYGMLISDDLVKIATSIGYKMYTVNGREFISDVAPTIVDGRTMVPVRFIAEALGAEVGWDDNTKTVTISLDSKTLRFKIGEKVAGTDVAAIISDNRTLVPLRYISEQLGANVIWHDVTKSISIYR